MEIIYAIVLGLVQGLTEFLPISSSGHLIIMRDILNFEIKNSLSFDALLQLATTFAIIVYFYKDLIEYFKSSFYFLKKYFVKLSEQESECLERNKKMIICIVVATIPAIFLGILLEKYMDTIFRNTLFVAITLILGSGIMFLADKISSKNFNNELSTKKSLIIGFFQSLALLPGMSRSGMTISGGLLLGLNREKAIKFSFLIAVPILLGSGLKKLVDLIQLGFLDDNTNLMSIAFGCAAAFVSGILAIHFLITYLKNNSFSVFIYYRIILALILIYIYF